MGHMKSSSDEKEKLESEGPDGEKAKENQILCGQGQHGDRRPGE